MYTLWPIQTKKDRGRRIFLQEYDQGILDPCQSVEIKFHGGRRNSYFRVGYSPARPIIFLEKKRGEGGREGRGRGSVCKSCQTLQRRTEQRQRVHPISLLGRKNFHYSLIPSSPPPPHLIVAPFTPSSPILYAVAPRRTLEDRYVKKKVRILFPEMLLPRKPFLLTLLPPPSISHHRRVSKLQEGGGGVLVDSLCGCGITRGHGWQTRLVRILFPKCGEDRFSSPRGWAATSGGNGNEGMMPCKPSPPPPSTTHYERDWSGWSNVCCCIRRNEWADTNMTQDSLKLG